MGDDKTGPFCGLGRSRCQTVEEVSELLPVVTLRRRMGDSVMGHRRASENATSLQDFIPAGFDCQSPAPIGWRAGLPFLRLGFNRTEYASYANGRNVRRCGRRGGEGCGQGYVLGWSGAASGAHRTFDAQRFTSATHKHPASRTDAQTRRASSAITPGLSIILCPQIDPTPSRRLFVLAITAKSTRTKLLRRTLRCVRSAASVMSDHHCRTQTPAHSKTSSKSSQQPQTP